MGHISKNNDNYKKIYIFLILLIYIFCHLLT